MDAMNELITATVAEILLEKTGTDGVRHVRVRFEKAGGGYAKTDLCSKFRNYARWKALGLEIGMTLTNLRLKDLDTVDADSYPRKLRAGESALPVVERFYRLVDREGDYVKEVISSDTETLKMHFVFTKNPEEAKRFSYEQLWSPLATTSVGGEFTRGFAGGKAEIYG